MCESFPLRHPRNSRQAAPPHLLGANNERRKAKLRAGDLGEEEIELASRGSQQGDVIPPPCSTLPRSDCANSYHADINMFVQTTSTDCLRQLHQHLLLKRQRRAGRARPVRSYRYHRRLSSFCMPEVFEILLYRPIQRGCMPSGWKPIAQCEINLHTGNGCVIPWDKLHTYPRHHHPVQKVLRQDHRQARSQY
ncbi:hypothetical protein HPB50_019325 [Hyalomma asiaticum]|uniref:Uncharacterized protein n=1 Tax=Hyalomma asiaticum TaxID=266040 RepID=A0ACB7RUG8_HYAAI|nr:hypothetical protein HPB50_019325 [Hyalomma asiaticum]